MARHRVSQGGIALIKRFEGHRPRAARLPDGRHVVGYGHTRSARAGAEVSEADAEALLRFDLQAVEAALDELVFTPLNQNQTDALGAFAFSVGADAFRRSNVLRRVNEGDLLGAAAALESWRRAEFEGEPIVVDALVRRRAAEKLLFLTPTDGFIAAPSAVLKPELDYGALPPRTPMQAAEIVAPLDGEEASAERLDSEPPLAPPEPSPALVAAERVSQRLQALFADETPPAAAEPATDTIEASPPPSSSTVISFDRPAEPEALPSHPVPDDDGVTTASADPDQTFDQRIARTVPVETAAPAQKESSWPYLALGALALALFAIAIAIILRAQAMGETSLLGARSLMGTTLAVVGIVGLCTAVYFWLKVWGDNAGRDGE